VSEPAPRGEFLASEESIISKLETEVFRPANPLITDLLASILIQIVPPEVTSSKHQLVRQAVMEANFSTSFRSPHTPVMTTTRGGIISPPPPSLVKTSFVPTPTTSGSDPIPLTALTIVLFTHNATGAPFSYGMPSFDTNMVLTYSILQTMSMGARIWNDPLQGSNVGTTAPFNSIPYGGGHIPPLSTSLDDAFQ
jgi:hypothetical protein